MTGKVAVVVTSAGTASAVNVIKSLRMSEQPRFEITAIDMNETGPGVLLADHGRKAPPYTEPGYIDFLTGVCRDAGASALFPIHSGEIELLASSTERFDRAGIATLLPPPVTVRLCNDKRASVNRAVQLGMCVPTIFRAGEESFPVFVKRVVGSGSKHAARVDTREELERLFARDDQLLVQELIEGVEITVDCLCDRSSELLVASPRLRLSTRDGQTVRGRTIEAPEVVDMCATFCRGVGMVGPCNLQFIDSGRGYIFIEVNPRYAAGGLMLTVHAGANIPLLAWRLMDKQSIEPPALRPGVTMIRYWEELFLEPKET